jgi:DNA-binding response OmpR family regulator
MNKKVLLIEDNDFLGELLSRTLTKEGFDVALVIDGSDAIAKMKEYKPDVVLLDIVLPHKNGYEILEEVVQDTELKKIPVIIISNSGQPVEISRVLKLGVRDYIVKAQINPEDVIAKIHQHLTFDIPATVTHTALQGKKVLWAEDDALLGDILEKKMQSQGAQIIHVKKGEDVLAYLEDETADIILLDLLLPGIDGIEVLKRLKANQKTKPIPVIILSNLNDKEHLAHSNEFGAERFLIKASLTLDDIVHHISETVSKHS